MTAAHGRQLNPEQAMAWIAEWNAFVGARTATALLYRFLVDGPKLEAQVVALAHRERMSWQAFLDAAAALGIRIRQLNHHHHEDGGEASSRWWGLASSNWETLARCRSRPPAPVQDAGLRLDRDHPLSRADRSGDLGWSR